MADAMIDKTKIRIEIEGCIYCGALWSDSWEVVKIVPIIINGKERRLNIHCCGDCLRSRTGVPLPMEGL